MTQWNEISRFNKAVCLGIAVGTFINWVAVLLGGASIIAAPVCFPLLLIGGAISAFSSFAGLLKAGLDQWRDDLWRYDQRRYYQRRYDHRHPPVPTPDPSPNSIRAERLQTFSHFKIPDKMVCPISHDIMTYPVFLPDAPQISFNRPEIECWIAKNPHNPCTRAPAAIHMLCANTALENEINDFLTGEEKRVNSAAKTIQRAYRKFFDRKKNVFSNPQKEDMIQYRPGLL